MSAHHRGSASTAAKYASGRIEDLYGPHYIPVSLAAPHSSLLKACTWIGMGMVLSCIPTIGIMVYAAGAMSVGTQDKWMEYLIIGAIFTVLFIVVGGGLIRYGRRDYLEYSKRTGRHS